MLRVSELMTGHGEGTELSLAASVMYIYWRLCNDD